MERVATIDTAVAVDREEEKRQRFVCLMNGIRTELYNFAFRLTGTREEAKDLLQESYFKAFKYFHQLREESKFKEWIFQIYGESVQEHPAPQEKGKHLLSRRPGTCLRRA